MVSSTPLVAYLSTGIRNRKQKSEQESDVWPPDAGAYRSTNRVIWEGGAALTL
jgi:hypothetical protein